MASGSFGVRCSWQQLGILCANVRYCMWFYANHVSRTRLHSGRPGREAMARAINLLHVVLAAVEHG
jgi:hypothetical protein